MSKFTTEYFISRANQIHNGLYDYSKVEYKSAIKKVCIIDPEYGEFWQTPLGHITGKQGHPQRGKNKASMKRRMSLDVFIKKANKRHNNLYDYSKVKYVNCDTKVCIIDPVYGEFWQSPYQHLRSHGCPLRTANKEWLINVDHIIPLSIIHSSRKKNTSWNKNRPLFKFLNSKINLKEIPAKLNKEKSDIVIINGKSVSACSVRNNYEIIGYLIQTLLMIDPTKVIDEDKKYVKEYFSI